MSSLSSCKLILFLCSGIDGLIIPFFTIFREGLWDPERGFNKGQRIEGLEFYADHLTWKKLPKKVFDAYGGYEQAKTIRKAMGYDKRLPQLQEPAGDGLPTADVKTNQPETSKVQNTTVSGKVNTSQREVPKLDSAASVVVTSKPSESSLPTIAQIKQKIVQANLSLCCDSNTEVKSKKPRLESENLPLPKNYHLPAVAWQLLESK